MAHRMTGRLLCTVAFAVLFVLPLGSAGAARAEAAPTAAPAEDAYTRAQALFNLRKFRETVTALDSYLASHPRDARALVLRGDAKAELDDNEGALKDYNAAIGIAPEYQYAYVTRCETRLTLDDPSGALSDCDTAVRLDPNDAHAYQDRGDVYFDRSAYDLALSDYDKAVALGRHGAYVFAARCDTNRILGKLDRAAADCDQSLTIDPKSRRGLWAHARLAMAKGRYSDAVADFNAYIAQDQAASNTGYYFRGMAYNRLQMSRNALEDLQTYVQRAPDDGDGYRERAVARFRLGDKDGAIADLDIALRLYTKDGNSAAAEKVTALAKAMRAGRPLPAQ
jgi:tetratricopeptide (TPR) repeat protein